MHSERPFPGGAQQDVLLKSHSVLIHASDEQDIIAALALCTDDQACLRLVYFDLDSTGMPSTMTVTANWQNGAPWRADSLLHHALPVQNCSLVSALEALPDPVWFVEDVSQHSGLSSSPLLDGVERLVAIKLFGVAQVENSSLWHGLILVTWPVPGHFTRDQQYLLVMICETVSSIVSHWRLYLEAQDNVRQLRRLDELKTDFLRTVSHELRAPLFGILTGAEALLDGSSDDVGEETRQGIEDIVQSGQHLLDVITDILDMAQIEAGTLNLCLESIDLADVVQESVQAIRAMVVQKGLTLTTGVEAGIPTIRGDKRRIRQILLNLLSNAVKFCERGNIQIKVHQEGQKLVVSVQDEGIGICREDQTVVFDQFRRLDSPVARRAGGTGLGLPISKRLVELHRGHIWLTSEPGRGSTFYFSLPIGGETDAYSLH